MQFYKVVTMFVDVFETSILGERHFGTMTEAQAWARLSEDEQIISVIIEM